MVRFIGEYKAKIDDKGRIIFPSAFKSMMGEDADTRFVVKKSLFADCLEMFAYQQWEKESDELKTKLNFFNRQHAAFWREYMRGTAIVEPEAKMGRMTIPKELLSSIGIEKEVVFSGNNHLIEIWSKEKFDSGKMDGDEYIALAEKLLG